MANQKRFMAQKGLDNNNNTITNVTDPVNSQDAATKAYADAAKASAISTAAADATTKANTAETNAKAYADTKVSALVASAPAALDTLNELATALGNDANFATTVTNSLAGKAANTITVTGTGALSGGGALSSNQVISHTNSGVAAGTYNNVTVNAYGHVTAGSNTAYLTSYSEIDTLASVTGRGATTSTAVTLSGGATVGSTGVAISGSTSGTTTLKSAAAASGTITMPAATGTMALTSDIGNGTLTVSAGTGLSGSGTFTANQSGNATITLTNTDTGSAQNIYKNISDGTTTASAGSNNDTIKFRAGTGITAVVGSNDATHGDNILITNTGVTSIAGTAPIAVSASTGSTTISLNDSGVTAGTYTKVTVDAKGRVTSGATASTTDITEGTNLYFTNARASAAAPVQSVAGRTGAVTLAVADVSGAASTTYVDTAVANLVASAPAALNTLNELATALGNDANFSTTVTNSIATKLSLSGGSLTGAVTSSSTVATTGGDFALANTTSNSTASQWHNRTGVKNAAADKAVFVGTYGSVAVAGAHNNALTAWADLYVNNVDGSNGGAVRMPSTTYVAGNQVIHAGNYNSYSPTLTGTGASGTWGISISGNAATATNASYATSAGSASTAGQVTINYNNDSNSTYQMLWGSGNSVYGTGGIYCNPSNDYLYAGSFYTGNWFRSSGQTGWYNESYAVGIYATEAGNVRTYNNASFIANNVTATGLMSSANGYQTTAYLTNQRNRIWSFANSDAYGLSYFQGTSGRGGSDSIGFHFGTASDAGSQFVMQSNGTFIATGELTAYSDAKVKTNVKTIENALDIVTKMRGVTFDRIQDGKASVGVIAQEVKEVLPQVVNYDEQADIHSVAYGNIVGVLIEAIKAQQVQIAELSAEVAKLKK